MSDERKVCDHTLRPGRGYLLTAPFAIVSSNQTETRIIMSDDGTHSRDELEAIAQRNRRQLARKRRKRSRNNA